MRLWAIGLILALGFLVAPLCSAAQPPGKVYRIGFLAAGSPPLLTPTPCLRGRHGLCGVPTLPVLALPRVQPRLHPGNSGPTRRALPGQPLGGRGNRGRFGQLCDLMKTVFGGVRGGSGGGGGMGKSLPFPSTLGVLSKPPSQPKTGPGGKDYPYQSVLMTRLPKDRHRRDTGAILEPADPQPASAPVFIFLHGAGAPHVRYYQEWMEHLAKKGTIVIYPYLGPGAMKLFLPLFMPRGWAARGRTAPSPPGGSDMQKTGCFPPAYEALAVQAIKHAITLLQTQPGHVRPDLAKVAYGGHSLGGAGAFQLASHYAQHGLPQPQALMLNSPCPVGEGAAFGDLPSDIKMLITAGDSAQTGGLVGNQFSRFITEAHLYPAAVHLWKNTTHVPDAYRDFVILHSDHHGSPRLNADHFAPLGAKKLLARIAVHAQVDALDWYGYWKLSTALLSCGFRNVDCQYALGNSPQQTDMGQWSDGTPVRKLEVTDTPPATLPP